jgi:Ca-activated chloride channel family protein
MKMDPRITAYAVGELESREREIFESELSASSTLQNEVAAIALLADKLAAGPRKHERFDPEIRAWLLNRCLDNQKSRLRSKRTIVWTGLGLAASFVAYAGLSGITDQSGPFKWTNFAPLRSTPPKTPFSTCSGTMPQVAIDNPVLIPKSEPTAPSASEPKAMPAPSDNAALVASGAPRRQMPHYVQSMESSYDRGGAIKAKRIETLPPWPRFQADGQRGGAIQAKRIENLPPPQSSQANFRIKARSSGVPSPFSAASRLPAEALQNESYAPIREVEFVIARENPLSTFSIDVDTASYSNVRRFLEQEMIPPADAIRTEELINYFRYDYPQPSGENAFSVNLEMNRAPWNPEHELVRVGLKGREISAESRGPANLVFLVDVSGSMNSPDKLPLLQRSLSALVENLSDDDRVAIVTYAGSSGLVLDSTQGKAKREILDAIANLRSGGSTNGSGGIKQAYETARQNFLKGGNNRVILCTDGDFNVGVTDQGGLQKLIETERESGVFLSVLGFGTGNLKDSTMEALADKGNGNYTYIDSISEGRKVLVEQMGSTLFTIAKDVKIQVEFNPARVAGYRLIGYENRLLAKEDFNNDKIDAGEIGAGHTVTALYEIIPAGQSVQGSPSVDPLKYQQPEQKVVTASNEILTVKVRYKAPDGQKSSLIEIPLAASEIPSPDKASEDFRFAAAVAAFGMKLRGSPHVGEIKWAEIQDIARGALGKDPGSYRAEFLTLIEKAKTLQKEAN